MISDSNYPSTGTLLAQINPIPNASTEVLAWGNQWVQFFAGLKGIAQAWAAQVDEKHSAHWVANWPPGVAPHQFPKETLQSVVRHGKALTIQDRKTLTSEGVFPLIQDDQVIGLIGLMSHQADYFTPETSKWISSLTGNIARSLFQEDYKNRERQLEFSIYKVLQSNLDIKNTLPVALEITAEVLKADAVIAHSHNPSTQQFETCVTYGLSTATLERFPRRHKSDLAGKLFTNGNQPVWVEDLRETPPGSHPINGLGNMGFCGYLALPLIAHHDIKGILEVFWQMPHTEKTYQVGFLERVSEQFAYAMEHDSILKNLQNNNQFLASGYNVIIEGLSRTLELRDLETDGHSQRVSRLTMLLAEHMLIPQEQWDDIRRGALLHDIGKIGIPDAILLKPGSLTDQERKMMQLHVVYAYNILSPTTTSRHTLDIIHYHHEHWNGKGYPDGLKGLQIPLVARIFSVVDVFDALTSDRPYRPAWSRSQALNYLMDQAGIQFDPKVVKAFMEIADGKP
ncbi:MAG: HD domain-containing protein [Chloroflexi bacterium]|nr:HD domain-containing protein [Chloroflexota bacterium]